LRINFASAGGHCPIFLSSYGIHIAIIPLQSSCLGSGSSGMTRDPQNQNHLDPWHFVTIDCKPENGCKMQNALLWHNGHNDGIASGQRN
jgi:hypothetical protein